MKQEEDKLIAQVIDVETGEILTNINEGDSIKRKKQKEFLNEDNNKIKNFKKGDEFVKVYSEAMDIIDDKITNAEARLLLRIMKYISYEDGILREDGKKGRHITIIDISKEYNLTYEAVRKQVYSLIRKGILGEHRTGNKNTRNVEKSLTVNPYIFLRGTIANKSICALFDKTGWNS